MCGGAAADGDDDDEGRSRLCVRVSFGWSGA